MIDKIYSSFEDKYINVMDIEKIIVEDGEGDLGYFVITAFVCENGKAWKRFPGDFDGDWTTDGLRGLAVTRNSEAKRCGTEEKCSVVALDNLRIRPDFKKSKQAMWDEMWIKVNNRVGRLCKDIKKAQNNIEASRSLSAITVKSYWED